MQCSDFSIAVMAIACLFATMTCQSSVAEDARHDFDTIVAPIFAAHCLECHAGDDAEAGLDLSRDESARAGGESGPVILAGDAESSLLWLRIESGEMPPAHELSDDDQVAIKTWIEAGAIWGTDPIDPFRFSNARRAGYDWWSLQPLRVHEPPRPLDDNWSINDLDRFILRRLREEELEPTPRADPRTLVRRLHLDLTGLPPSPEVIQAFAANPSQSAWIDLVDRLLDSPDYGARWAQHWLDVARFAETDGYEYNAPRDHAWHYRDWVIDALNRDLGYDEFARMQIAGDVIEPDTRDGLAAVGFLVAGIHNTVVGDSETMKIAARHEALEEIAGTTAQAFLGLTVNCARCHDHKFDPISTQEYYEFIAALDGIAHGTRRLEASTERDDRLVIDQQIAQLKSQLYESIRSRGDRISQSANTIETTETIEANRDGQSYTVSFLSAPTVWAIADQATSAEDRLIVSIIRDDQSTLVEKRIAPGDWMESGHEQVFRPFDFSYEGDGRGEVRIRITSTPHEGRFGGALDELIVRDGSGHVIFSEEFDDVEQTANRGTQADTDLPVFWGLNSTRWNAHGLHSIHAVEHEENNLAIQLFSGSYDVEPHPQTEQEQAWLAQLRALEEQLEGITIYTVVGREPVPMRLLERGDPRLLGRVVAPGGLAAIANLNPDFGLSEGARDRDRRIKLAEWVTHPDNAPFHRVIVNRVWHYHFGRGLVQTPNDFGFMGGHPTHPELLDWLAIWLRDHDYSLKALHRLIVTSATYQQGSRADLNPTSIRALAIDGDNLLLWRQNPKRIDAEAFRDGLLQMAGELNRQSSGPGYRDTAIETIGAAHYYRIVDPVGSEFNRRTIFRFRARGERSALLDSFDCPDPSVTTPQRTVTTTPLQALSQWNDAFVLRMAGHLANRVRAEFGSDSSGGSIDAQIRGVWWLVLGREPSQQELTQATRLIEDHSMELLCRVLFNLNELILIE